MIRLLGTHFAWVSKNAGRFRAPARSRDKNVEFVRRDRYAGEADVLGSHARSGATSEGNSRIVDSTAGTSSNRTARRSRTEGNDAQSFSLMDSRAFDRFFRQPASIRRDPMNGPRVVMSSSRDHNPIEIELRMRMSWRAAPTPD